MSAKVIQSYVWHKSGAWFVSTIERDYDTYVGVVHGPETMVWEWDPATKQRGDSIIHHGDEGLDGHLRICRALAADGVVGLCPDDTAKTD